MTAWTKNPELLRALVLSVLAAVTLSACTTSPRTQLSWNVQDHNTYYGPHAVKLPRVEQRHLAPLSQQKQASNTYYTPKPKPRTTPGWYTANYSPPAQSSTRTSDPASQGADPSAHFAWPIKGRIIANYGVTDNGGRNDGINIAALQGAPVRAAASGTVSYCGNELRGYGNLVLIKHDNGYITAYAHVDSFLVGRDDRVAAGQVIAYAGATGDVTVPQLHFEIRQGIRPIDPKVLLPKSVVLASN
jgi:murein DD-endopeptidase MepM/ murein hydrolase activator NlpD